MKYCKKHNQKYMDFLTDCPTCVGVRLGLIAQKANLQTKKEFEEKYGSVKLPESAPKRLIRAITEKEEKVPFSLIEKL